MRKLHPGAWAVISVAALLALSACAGAPVDDALSPSARSTPSVSPTPTSVPTPQSIAQAFGGDCDEMLAESEISELIGSPVTPDPISRAFQRIGEEASVVREGGIFCGWQTDEVVLSVVVLPLAIIPSDLASASNDYPCVSGFTQCSWYAASDQWWTYTTESPKVIETWTDDPAVAERAARLVTDRADEWVPPTDSGSPEAAPDCAALRDEVSAAVPDAALQDSGWGISGVEAIALSSGITSSCAWSNSSGIISLRMQAGVGAPAASDLALVGAEQTSLPGGATAYLVSNGPGYSTLIATVGETRVALGGDSVANDPQGTAAILAAVLEAL